MKLTNEDVQEIVKLVDNSAYDELHIETDSFTLTLRRTADGDWTREQTVSRAPVLARTVEPIPAPGSGSGPGSDSAMDAGPTDASLVAVPAPLPGTFYRAPSPGAAPFVEIGSRVEPATVVGIIETMKLMNSVHAGTAGVVEQICVTNAQPAEQGAALMRIRVLTT